MLLASVNIYLLLGVVVPLTEPVKVASTVAKQPKASRLAISDAELASKFTTNMRHETVPLDAASRFMLQGLTGHKSAAELTASLVAEGRAGRILFTEDGQQAKTLELNAQIAERHAALVISHLARAALLVP